MRNRIVATAAVAVALLLGGSGAASAAEPGWHGCTSVRSDYWHVKNDTLTQTHGQSSTAAWTKLPNDRIHLKIKFVYAGVTYTSAAKGGADAVWLYEDKVSQHNPGF